MVVVRRGIILLMLLLPFSLTAQEVLLPLQQGTAQMRPQSKTTTALQLPFFDDFATGALRADHWLPGGASTSFDVSPLAPTVGTATLDALDVNGQLYGHASTGVFPADTLCSSPIDLGNLTVDDSVVLSFYYLPGGGFGNMWERVGECPDPQDSLYVDFFSPSDSTWVTVWSHEGISVDTLMSRTGRAWQYVVLPLNATRWFDSNFCFRFRSHASLEESPKAGRMGNCDYWHLDYVQLDRGRELSTTPESRDVAFAAPAPTMLREYRAMPYRQYSTQAMAPMLEMKIVNLYSSALASHYAYTVTDTAGTVLYVYDGGFENAPAFEPEGNYQTSPMHANPAVTYTFPAMTAPAEYRIVHTVREGTGGDLFPWNDTVRYRQVFGNYYAYDDGSAENGYGITSTASQLYLAYRFDLNQADTLTAVDIWFNHTKDEGNEAIPFYVTLWKNTDDGTPGEVLYRDEERRFAQTGGFARYILEHQVVVDGTVFVGFEQTGNDYLNLGYDRSLNTADRIYYLTGTEWQQSILSGSLMLRPCFGASAAVAIPDLGKQTFGMAVYPNPASDRMIVSGLPQGSRIQLYDCQGRLCKSESQLYTNGDKITLVTAGLPEGLYLLRAVALDGTANTVKLIIKH